MWSHKETYIVIINSPGGSSSYGISCHQNGRGKPACHLNYRCLEHTGATSAGLLLYLALTSRENGVCAPYRPDCSLHCWVWCWRVFYFIFSDFIIGYWLYTYCLPFRDFKGELQGRHRNQFGRGVSGVPGEEIGMDILLTQIELLIIGLGSAMLVNLVYMPNSEGAMMEIRQKVDGLFSVIFRHFAYASGS